MPRTTLDALIARGLPAALAVARAVRRRVELLAKKYPDDTPAMLLSRARRELRAVEPVLARVVSDSILAGWMTAARNTAREALPSPTTGEGESPLFAFPPAPPKPPSATIPTPAGGDPEPVVRFPAIEAGVRDLSARQVFTPAEYEALADDAKAAAFTVARATTRDAAEAVRAAIVEDVRDGGTLKEFRAKVRDAMGDSALSDAQVETVYRTQVGLAHATGLRDVLDHPLVSDEFPFVSWSATHDSRVRTHHLEMETNGLDGTSVYWIDDPTIQLLWPPFEWNCRCVVTPFGIEDAAAAGVKVARRWLETGNPPKVRRFVPMPSFRPPKGFPRGPGFKPVVA